jgi:hypothetical protein
VSRNEPNSGVTERTQFREKGRGQSREPERTQFEGFGIRAFTRAGTNPKSGAPKRTQFVRAGMNLIRPRRNGHNRAGQNEPNFVALTRLRSLPIFQRTSIGAGGGPGRPDDPIPALLGLPEPMARAGAPG